MSESQDNVTGMEAPIYLQYNFTAGRAPTRFLTRIKQGLLTAQGCAQCAPRLISRKPPYLVSYRLFCAKFPVQRITPRPP